jgi:hypothetical protein
MIKIGLPIRKRASTYFWNSEESNLLFMPWAVWMAMRMCHFTNCTLPSVMGIKCMVLMTLRSIST